MVHHQLIWCTDNTHESRGGKVHRGWHPHWRGGGWSRPRSRPKPLWPAWPLVKPRRLWHTHSIEISEISKVLMGFFYLPQDGILCQPTDGFFCFVSSRRKEMKRRFYFSLWRRFYPRIMTEYQNCITIFMCCFFFFLYVRILTICWTDRKFVQAYTALLHSNWKFHLYFCFSY